MTRTHWSISSVTSWRIVSAVFFLRSQSFLNRAQTADWLADIHQITAQLLVVAKLGDFLLRLTYRCRVGQRLGEGLPETLVGKAQVWAMTRIVGSRAVAVRFPTTPHGTDDGTRAHIVEIGDRA